MILNNEEKKRIVRNLSWMVDDMKHRHDQLKGNLEEGIQGDYSPQLKEAIILLGDVERVMTTETTGCHRKSVLVNCREFACSSNRHGICAASKITLESVGTSIVGRLKCVQAEKKKEGEMK